MRPFKAGIILGVGLMFVGMALAYYKVRDAEWEKVFEINAKIREITYADSLLDLEVLRIRSGAVEHYDDVTHAYDLLRATFTQLNDRIQGTQIQKSSLAESLAHLEQHINRKLSLVEHIKSQNSILRNSESYLPALLDEYSDEQESNELIVSLHKLLLRTIVLTDREASDALKLRFQSLSPFKDAWDSMGDIQYRVMMHGIKTLEVRQSLVPMLREYLKIPVHQDIAEISDSFSRELAHREMIKERFRNILYGSAFGFFILSLVVLTRFFNLNRKIRTFVPFEMLNLLGKKSLLNIEFGASTQKEMTVMFVDLRDFTRTCEVRQPAENFAFVNEYLAAISPSIQLHHGFISQFTGDGIMALFPGEPQHALAAAIHVIEALSKLNQNRQSRGEEAIHLGIGINTSELMLGTIGHRRRMECTVLGTGVNVAARVEGLTRVYGCEVLLTESTFKRLKEPEAFQLRVIDKVRPKGLQEAIQLYELLDVDHSGSRPKKLAMQQEFQKGRDLYTAQRYQEAAAVFSTCASFDAVALLYQQRCQDYALHPPPHDWDGVTDFSSK